MVCLALLYSKMSSTLLNKRIAGRGRIWTRYTTYFLDQLNARSCTFLDFMHCHFHSLEAGFDFLPIFGQMSSFDRKSTGLTLRRSKLYFYKIVKWSGNTLSRKIFRAPPARKKEVPKFFVCGGLFLVVEAPKTVKNVKF